LSKQNRPVIRDGRLQVKKKRTDRSYLSGGTAAVSDQPDEQELATPPPEAEAPAAVAAARVPATPSKPVQAAAAATPSAGAAVRASGAARALQQQGVQKRRVVDTEALARRDTRYALHELRRIGILTVLVITSLVVAAITLR
jgi:hypothetical protein